MSERFYVNWPLQAGPVTLEGAEAHHLARVSRFRAGDAVCLFNGDGHEYPARVMTVERRSVQLEVLQRETPCRELPFRLEVAAPLPKGDRAHFLLEKLTELGVTKFVPLKTARSVVLPRESRLENLQRYVIEASKQCGRNVLMGVGSLAAWADYCRLDELAECRVLGHPGGAVKVTALANSGQLTRNVVCAVGPEGGFTEDEGQMAVQAGWQQIDLGPRTLRVETAALVLAAVVILGAGTTAQ